ncbi:11663_t:CDS:2 [Scutellospora calospora]|uniref:11663_t:CDS:1 n=1 Tax=Scutellospora calospora TaxID=85575 RepID=A0ACA9KJZ2_9GLOM|nr:11663_t:CDS:2 [Scutellospora calospora]
MEYYILPEQQPIIIINPAPPPPNPPNTPEQTPKTDENPSDSNKPENNKPEDDKTQKSNDDKTQNGTQPIVIVPPTQYFFIPTNWTYLNPYTWCNIL